MSKKPTTADAQLILQLYDLRREPEMRKARNWVLTEFWPRNADDYVKTVMAMGTQENAWLRQVSSYWNMAASFALSGALNSELFLQPAVSGEMFFLFAKVHPFLKELREKMGEPKSFSVIEKLIASSKDSRNRLNSTLKRVRALKEKRAGASAR
ncbi:MAG: hypothetical protein WCC95_15235 [Candidatus Sulfotelmatobacter sp.]|jgi:hypothetical protein